MAKPDQFLGEGPLTLLGSMIGRLGLEMPDPSAVPAGKKTKAGNVQLSEKEKSLFVWGVIRDGQKSVAELFIAQIQDYLVLGKGCRLNTPATASGNWSWRLKDGALTNELAKKIRHITKLYGR